VFRLNFFPFINLLTIVLMVGVGADDAFILRQCWMKARRACGGRVHVLVEQALESAAVSMLVGDGVGLDNSPVALFLQWMRNLRL